MAETTGTVIAVNPSGSGIKVGDTWLNYGQRVSIPNKPIKGQRVTVQHDADRWITAVEILDGGVVTQRPTGGGMSRPRMTEEERGEVRHMNVLRTAADFAGRKSQT